MKKSFLWPLFCMFAILASCSEEFQNTEEAVGNVLNDKKTRADISNENCLSFNSLNEFETYVDQIKQLPSPEEKFKFVEENFPEFESIQERFEEAGAYMDENVDNTEESYRNFQDTFDCFYFPMYKEDAGFYIPMTDLDAAYLCNTDCEVIIGDKRICMRDIYDYGTLQQTGRAYYEEAKALPLDMPSSYGEKFVMDRSVNSAGPEYDSLWIHNKDNDRKLKLKVRRRILQDPDFKLRSYSKLHTEICFRKKTWLGWSNYSTRTVINGTWTYPVGTKGEIKREHSGNSSHDYEVFLPIYIRLITNKIVYYYPDTKIVATVEFRGFAEPTSFDFRLGPTYAEVPTSPNMQHFELVPSI